MPITAPDCPRTRRQAHVHECAMMWRYWSTIGMLNCMHVPLCVSTWPQCGCEQVSLYSHGSTWQAQTCIPMPPCYDAETRQVCKSLCPHYHMAALGNDRLTERTAMQPRGGAWASLLWQQACRYCRMSELLHGRVFSRCACTSVRWHWCK